MKFSIITICYNPGPVVLEALESVRSQANIDVESVVVDGKSSDGTVELLQDLNGSIATLISEPDRGLYDALNKGVHAARGDIIGFVHADDLLAYPRALQDVAACFARSGADGVYGDLEYVRKEQPNRVVRYWRSGDYSPGLLRRGWMPPHPALYLKREVYEQARLENGDYFDINMTCAADYDFMIRVLGRYHVRLAYLPKVLVRMRMGGISNRSVKHIWRKSCEDLVAMRRNGIGGLATLMAKNLRKLPQFIAAHRHKPRCPRDEELRCPHRQSDKVIERRSEP